MRVLRLGLSFMAGGDLPGVPAGYAYRWVTLPDGTKAVRTVKKEDGKLYYRIVKTA